MRQHPPTTELHLGGHTLADRGTRHDTSSVCRSAWINAFATFKKKKVHDGTTTPVQPVTKDPLTPRAPRRLDGTQASQHEKSGRTWSMGPPSMFQMAHTVRHLPQEDRAREGPHTRSTNWNIAQYHRPRAEHDLLTRSTNSDDSWTGHAGVAVRVSLSSFIRELWRLGRLLCVDQI